MSRKRKRNNIMSADNPLSLEKLRLNERMMGVEREMKQFREEQFHPLQLKMTEFIATVTADRERQKETLEAVKKVAEQNSKILRGDNGDKGHVTRIDRLEQSEQHRKTHIRFLWAAVAGFLGKISWDVVHFFTQSKGH